MDWVKTFGAVLLAALLAALPDRLLVLRRSLFCPSPSCPLR